MTSSITSTQSGLFGAVDISKLKLPDILEPISYEQCLDQLLDDLEKFLGEPYIFHEADPAYIVLQACAYRRMLDRLDYQNQTKQNLVAYASGDMLDHMGANPLYKCPRLTIVKADPNATPPVEAVMEKDDDYRRRLTLSNEGHTTAGSTGAYLYHALSAHGDVRDAGVMSYMSDGSVDIYILGQADNGHASDETITAVIERLNSENVRPLSEVVRVHRTKINTYEINIEMTVYPGPDSALIRDQALADITLYVNTHFANGHDITRAGINAAAGVAGMQNLNITSPVTDIINDASSASRCTSISITMVGSAI